MERVDYILGSNDNVRKGSTEEDNDSLTTPTREEGLKEWGQ